MPRPARQEAADALSTRRHHAAASARQRAYRRRKREGLICVEIELDHFEIAELLVGAGLLEQWDSEDRAKVRDTLEASLRSGALRITPFAD
jgi:hypothetical protein